MQGLGNFTDPQTVLILGGLLHGQIQAAEFGFFFFHLIFHFGYSFLQRFQVPGTLGNNFRSFAPQIFFGQFGQANRILMWLLMRAACPDFFLPAAFVQKALVTAVKNFDAVTLKYNQSLGKGVQIHLVMGYHDHGAVKVIYGG